jgi:hypothetical protein
VVAELDSQFMRIESGEGAQKTVQKMARSEMSSRKETQSLKSLIVWLQMEPKAILSDYHVEKLGRGHFRFEPINLQESPFKKLELHSSDGQFVDQLTIFEKSNDLISIDFKSPKVKLSK